jgi:hypothetical protein
MIINVRSSLQCVSNCFFIDFLSSSYWLVSTSHERIKLMFQFLIELSFQIHDHIELLLFQLFSDWIFSILIGFLLNTSIFNYYFNHHIKHTNAMQRLSNIEPWMWKRCIFMSILMGMYSLIKLKIGRYEQHKQTNKQMFFFYYMDFHLDFKRGGEVFFFKFG